MEAALRQQAHQYFQGLSSNLQKSHGDAVASGSLLNYYIFLISKFLPSGELTSKVITLHTSGSLDWSVLIRAVWSYSLVVKEGTQQYGVFAQFIGDIDRKGIVERNVLLKNLPEELIESAAILKKNMISDKARKAYTKFYYNQNKYNLLRENNEGFAKLSLLLASLKSHQPEEMIWDRILELIGNFDLDPDRVLDLIIQTYTISECSTLLISLIKKFNPLSIATLLGNRIVKQCNLQVSQEITYVGKVDYFLNYTMEQIHKQTGFMSTLKAIELCCFLIKQQVISLEAIFPYLNPHDEILDKTQFNRLENGKQKVLKAFKMILEEIDEVQRQKQEQEDNLMFLGQMLYSSKLALLAGLVQVNDWKNFSLMWELLKNKLDLLLYQPLLSSLMNMMEWVIDPQYQKISMGRHFKGNKKRSPKEFPLSDNIMNDGHVYQIYQCHNLFGEKLHHLELIFKIVGEYIGFNCRIYTKLCRLFVKILKEPLIFHNKHTEGSIPGYEEVREKIMIFISNYMVPGISYQEHNPSLSNQIFQLLECFDYRFRYSCYMRVYKYYMVANPYLGSIFQKIKNKQNVVVNNLSKDNKKTFVKKMAKLTHNHALQVFYWIFKRLILEDYEKVVSEVVSALSGSCQMTLEMSMFVTIHAFNQIKQAPMNFKTGDQAAWFRNMIDYTSLFYRKYLEVDIQPVFDYIVMKINEPVRDLEDNEQLPGSLLNLLHGLLNKMFGSFMIQELNKAKYEMICAGPRMQFQAMYISSEIKAAKKSKLILQKFFWDQSVDQHHGQSLALNMLILLTQKRAQLIHKSYISNIKLIGDIYDDYTLLIMQLVRVLNYQSSNHDQYRKLLPEGALDILINSYRLPLEISFEVYRPSINHISLLSNEEWDSLTNQVESVMGKFAKLEDKYINSSEVDLKLKNYLSQNYHRVQTMMTKSFFTTFWMLTLDSIYFPQKLYADKLEELKKIIDQKRDKSERDLEKARTLNDRITKEEEQQRKKMQDTMKEENAQKFAVDYLKSGDKSAISNFAEVFVQICLLPRMLLDPSEALYCTKFTLQIIKWNKLSASKSIKLLTFITEYVMNYLPFATKRESSFCLAIFLSEILGIFINWNEPTKLRQDIKKHLAIEESMIKDYPKLKQYILKVLERVGALIMGIKEEPYVIKNCLYLLTEIQALPGYLQQAEQLQIHASNLKEQFQTPDMQTILDRQLTILGNKKKTLPSKGDKKNLQATPPPSSKTPKGPSPLPVRQAQEKIAKQQNQSSQIKRSEMEEQPKKVVKVEPMDIQKAIKEKPKDEKLPEPVKPVGKSQSRLSESLNEDRIRTVKEKRDENEKKFGIPEQKPVDTSEKEIIQQTNNVSQPNLQIRGQNSKDLGKPSQEGDKQERHPTKHDQLKREEKFKHNRNSYTQEDRYYRPKNYEQRRRDDKMRNQEDRRGRDKEEINKSSKEEDNQVKYKEKGKEDKDFNQRKSESQSNRKDIQVESQRHQKEGENSIRTVREEKEILKKNYQKSHNPDPKLSPNQKEQKIMENPMEAQKSEKKPQKQDRYNKERSSSFKKESKDYHHKDYKKRDEYRHHDQPRRGSKDRTTRKQDKYDRDRRRESKDKSRDRDRHYRK